MKEVRLFFVMGCLASLAGACNSAWAQGAGKGAARGFPDRPIRMLVPFAPGGNTDILARAVSSKLDQSWGKPVVVDNRPGGSGIIATQIVQQATPDGHTILVGSTGELAINPSLFRKLPYNVERDFVPITLGTVSPLLLVRHPSFPAKTVKELVALGKSKPRTYAYASVGIGSPMHLSGELFKMIAGADFIHVPYKGGAPATAALIGGQEAHFGFVGMGPVLPHVKAGRLNALAISTARRSPSISEVPTLQEEGIKGFDTSIWFAFVAPAKTPKRVVTALNAELVRILKLPDVVDYLNKTGVNVAPGSPDDLARFIKAERDKYQKIINTSGTRID
jgi:tripartite-type tricarboxylate transporter receptor subunit TctC